MNENEQLRDEMSEIAMTKITLEKEADDRFAALRDDEDRIVGEGYYRLAKVYYDKADLEKAEEFFEKALSRTTYPQDTFAMFKIYGFLIRICSENLRADDAEEYIEKAQELLDKCGQDLGSLTAEYFFNAGVVSNYKGKFDEALNNFELAYKKAQQENEPDLIAKSLYSMATASYQVQKYNEALNFLSQLKELLTILKKDYLKGTMHILYGNIYKDQGQYKLAAENFDLAIKILQQKNCWNLYSYILLGRGIVLKKMGEYNQSLIFFKLALNSVPEHTFQRLTSLVKNQVEDVNDSSVDLYLDRHNRLIHEKSLGTIDFKHRFVLLEILFLMARNAGQHFNKEDLAKLIWKDEYNPLIHDKLIYTSISRLRKLIEPKGSTRKYILRDKDGYTFNPRINARFHKENDNFTQKVIGNVEISSPV